MTAKVFLTGATGFIGSPLLRRLAERGDEVICLVRNPARAGQLSGPNIHLVKGDITEREAMREAMTGVDLVIHAAAWYEIGAIDTPEMERVNVAGTENTLGLAYELGIGRILYVSTCAIFGDTHGVLATEEYERNTPFESEYARTKVLAHEYARKLTRQGAPIVIAMPGVVYGPGDHSLFGILSRMYLQRRMWIMSGPDGAYSHTYVDDVADGIVRVADQGRSGEQYILAGEPLTFRQMFDLWHRLTGIPGPMAYLPAAPLVPPLKLLGPISRRLPASLRVFTDAEIIGNSAVTVLGCSDKARSELGWSYRPAEEGWRETLEWEKAHL